MGYVSACRRYLCYVVYLIANNDFIDCNFRTKHVPQPYIYNIDIYSNGKFPFLHISSCKLLVTVVKLIYKYAY